LFQNSVLRIVLGLPFLLFFPGYTLQAALFPRKSDLGGTELAALSVGLSVAVVALTGLILNYTPWGVQLYPILTSLALLIVVAAAIAWARRRRLNDEERRAVSFSLNLQPWRGKTGVDRVLSLVLAVVVLGTLGSIGYAVAAPGEEERFTEFYLLGPGGRMEGYPDELVVGEKATVIVCIANHEHKDVDYALEITIDGARQGEITRIALAQDEKWQQQVSFAPDRAGEGQRVEFVLHKDGEPYRRLHLSIDVRGQQ